MKNESHIGHRPIKEDIIYLILSKNEPQISQRPIKGFYVYNLILLKNEPQIGRSPIKRGFMFIIKFCWKISPKSAKGLKRGILYIQFNFVKKWLRPIKGVRNGMKGVFECISQKYGGSYKLLSSIAGMIETSAASHMILKFILNGSLPENWIENR